MTESFEHVCSCECGANTFTVKARPLLRTFCHCTICQAFNQAPYADICMLMARDVELPDNHSVDFQTYRKPPAVQRGKCQSCDKPTLEYLRMGPFPDFAIVPVGTFPAAAALPEPALHMFYNRRVADADDDLPKYNGYWPSQLGSIGALIKARLRR